MDDIKLPMTVAKIQDSLSSERLSKNRLHKGFITDTINKDGKLELRWTHADFTFMKMVLMATSELVEDDLNGTVVYDLQSILEVQTSRMNKTRNLTIKGLSIEDIKPMLSHMFEVWSVQYAKLQSLNKWNSSAHQKTHCIAIKQANNQS